MQTNWPAPDGRRSLLRPRNQTLCARQLRLGNDERPDGWLRQRRLQPLIKTGRGIEHTRQKNFNACQAEALRTLATNAAE